MKQFTAITKKEFFESIATFRLYILAAVFLMFGIMSPLIAKLTPDIIRSLMDTGELEGVFMSVPEPTAMDSWGQFFKNVGQMGILTLVITFSGIMANEISRGTLVNLITKGLKRHTVILSKFLSASIMWAVSYALCLGVCYLYTMYFWDTAALNHTFLAFASPWVFGELMLSLLVFGGTLFGNIYGSLLSCLGAVVAINVISIFPDTARYNPVSLSSGTLSLLAGLSEPSDFIPAFIICLTAVIILLTVTMGVFKRKTL